MEKYGRAGQATNENMVHAHCVLDTEGYKHTLRICNTYCFSTTPGFTKAPDLHYTHNACLTCDGKVLCAVCFTDLTNIRIYAQGSSILPRKLE